MRAGTHAERQPSFPFPWLWLLPSLALLAGLVVWGIVVYPRLPDRIPQHMGPDGVDAYAAKSVGSVFLPVFVYAGVLAVTGFTAEALRRLRPESELGPGERTSPLVNRPRTRAGAIAVTRATLFLGGCLGMVFVLTCTIVWRTEPQPATPAWLLPVILALVAAGTLALLAAAVHDRRTARRART